MSFVPEQVPLLSNLDEDDTPTPAMAKAQSQTHSCSSRRRMKFHLKLGTRYGSQIGSFFEEKPAAEIVAEDIEQVAISPTLP